ncbi:MAG: 30S ribosomal protein THX [Ginsengibacter sp.]
MPGLRQEKNCHRKSDFRENFLKQDAVQYCILLFLFATINLTLTKITYMGRGDKKTKKGKIFMGSFGKSRPVTKSKSKAAEKSRDKKEA